MYSKFGQSPITSDIFLVNWFPSNRALVKFLQIFKLLGMGLLRWLLLAAKRTRDLPWQMSSGKELDSWFVSISSLIKF